jgi:hypothetical protein
MGYEYDYKQRVPARRARVTDGSGNVGLSLQRPGFRIIDSASSDTKERAAARAITACVIYLRKPCRRRYPAPIGAKPTQCSDRPV